MNNIDDKNNVEMKENLKGMQLTRNIWILMVVNRVEFVCHVYVMFAIVALLCFVSSLIFVCGWQHFGIDVCRMEPGNSFCPNVAYFNEMGQFMEFEVKLTNSSFFSEGGDVVGGLLLVYR